MDLEKPQWKGDNNVVAFLTIHSFLVQRVVFNITIIKEVLSQTMFVEYIWEFSGHDVLEM